MTQVAKHSCSRLIFCLLSLLSVCALFLQSSPAHAQTPYDALAVAPTTVGRVGIAMNITAGPSGAPGGFTVCWMTLADFLANGSDWSYAESVGADMDGSFTGTPTKHTAGGTITSYVLAPSQTVTIEIGDLFDETGVATTDTDELEPGATYAMCAFANGFGGQSRSEYSITYERTTDVVNDCLYTQGYWKNHASVWPASTLTLGTVSYTQAELLSILNTPAQGNGLIFLAHQLIATKLNIAAGASGSAISATIAAADALIGSLVVPPIGAGYLAPSSASGLTNAMDDYNNGELGSDPCIGVSTQSTTWGQIKALYHK
jgi:hypothetical protein